MNGPVALVPYTRVPERYIQISWGNTASLRLRRGNKDVSLEYLGYSENYTSRLVLSRLGTECSYR